MCPEISFLTLQIYFYKLSHQQLDGTFPDFFTILIVSLVSYSSKQKHISANTCELGLKATCLVLLYTSCLCSLPPVVITLMCFTCVQSTFIWLVYLDPSPPRFLDLLVSEGLSVLNGFSVWSTSWFVTGEFFFWWVNHWSEPALSAASPPEGHCNSKLFLYVTTAV